MQKLQEEAPLTKAREKEIVVGFQKQLVARFDYFWDMEIIAPE